MKTSPTPPAPRTSTGPAPDVIGRPARVTPAAWLAVFLHGVGDNAASFQGVVPALAGSLEHADVLVPDGFHAFDGGGGGAARQWFSVSGVTEENRPARVAGAGGEVSSWIDSELARRGLSGDRLVVVGFSQGAIVASWLAMHRSPRPAAVVMLSGRVAEVQPPSPGSPTPVLVAHGSRDPVIAVSNVERTGHVLEAWGLRVTTLVRPDLGHQVDAIELAQVNDFLQSSLTSH